MGLWRLMRTTKERKTLLGRALSPSDGIEEIVYKRLQPSAKIFHKVYRAVLFSDIVGSTAYFEKYGDEIGMSMVEQHNELLFPCVDSNNGEIIKTIGDAIMASFECADDAVRCAVDMQKALKSFNVEKASMKKIRVRIGINFGEVILQDGDLYGDVVNAAARIESLAEGDMILVSAQVRDALVDSEFITQVFAYDAVYVKGKSSPMEVFQVGWDPTAQLMGEVSIPIARAGDLLGGRFEIIELLGEGGMGQVFKAMDRALDEQVALKFVRPGLANDADSLEMFKSEVKLARSITHPNICRIHEFLQMEGKTFLSMELVEGISLSEWIELNCPASLQQVLPIIAGMTRGMQAAHDRGVTHRDLKPANIMIERETGRVVIMDFGIARLAGKRHSEHGELVAGTPEYLPPEQAMGLAVGPTGDIYSLSIIAYEMFAGRCPFEGDSPEQVAQMQVDGVAEPLENLVKGLPAEVTRTIMKSLEKDPKNRHSSALDFARSLGIETESSSTGTGKRKLFFSGLAGVVLVLILLGLFWAFHPGPPGGERKVKPFAVSSHVEQSPRWSSDGKVLAFFKDGRLYTRSLLNRSTRMMSEIKVPLDFEFSGISWLDNQSLLVTSSSRDDHGVFKLDASENVHKLPMVPLGPVDTCCHGEKIVYVRKSKDGNSELVSSGLYGNDEVVMLTSDPKISYERPRWSPDGKTIAIVIRHMGFNRTRDIGVVKSPGSLKMLTSDGLTHRVENTDPTWTNNGEWIVYSSRRNGTMSLWCVSAEGGESYPLSQATTQQQRIPDVSSAGIVAFQTSSKRLSISSMSMDGKLHEELSGDQFSNRFPVFSPDGSMIAFRSIQDMEHPKKRVLVVISKEKNSQQVFELPDGVRDFSWCGHHAIAYSQTVDNSRNLGVFDLDTGDSRTLVAEFYRLWSPSADVGCKQVIFSGQRQEGTGRKLWKLDIDTGSIDQLGSNDGTYMYPSLSPDSRFVAYRWAPSLRLLGMSELRLLSLKTGKVKKVTSHSSFRHSMRRIRWVANSEKLYYMESSARGGVLWSVRKNGSRVTRLLSIDDIDTFDFDVCPDGKTLIYPSVKYDGDVFTLSGVQW